MAKEKVLRHLAEFHFQQRIMARASAGPAQGTASCPDCHRLFTKESGFVLHYGLEHGAVESWLREINVVGW